MSTIENIKDVEIALAAAAKRMEAAENRAATAEQISQELRAKFDEVRIAQAQAAAGRDAGASQDEVSREYVVDRNELGGAEFRPDQVFTNRETGRAVVLRSCEHDSTGRMDGLLDSAPLSDWQRKLHDVVTRRNLIRMMMKRPHTPRYDRLLRHQLSTGPDEIRAVFKGSEDRIFTNASGVGAETIFDLDMPMLERRIDLERAVGSLFQVIPVNKPTGTSPFLTAGLRPQLGGPAESNDPANFLISTASLAQRTYATKPMVIRSQVDRDAAEDAFDGFLNSWIAEFGIAHNLGEEDVIVNGHAAGTQDAIASWNARGLWGASTFGSKDHRRHSDGLRARAREASATFDAGSGTNWLVKMRAMRGKLDAGYGVANGAFIVSPEHWLKNLLADDDFKQISDFGAMQSMVQGVLGGPLPNQVAVVDGTPVIVSWLLTADHAATGLYTGSGTTTGCIYVRRDRFRLYVRQGRRFEVDDEIRNNTRDYVLSSRFDFKHIDGSATKNAFYDFNIPG